MIIIGEKINGTRQEVAIAIANRDSRSIKRLVREQIDAGADYLDLNAGTHPGQEPEDMVWLVTTVQEEVPGAKLCLDSANSKALSAGIEAARQLPMINSLSGEKDRVANVLPLACNYKTELVILALDDKGIPKTAAKRLEIVRSLVRLAREGGLEDSMLYIDPLVTTIATDNQSGQTAFETIRQLRVEFPNAHITCGLSNISFGQPARSLINQAFAALAIGAGADSAILDPCKKGLRNMIYSAELVTGQDRNCLRYINAFRKGLIGPVSSSGSEIDTEEGALPKKNVHAIDELVDALVGMQKANVSGMTKELLAGGADPMEIIHASKKAMSEVGRLFEAQEYFIPELILAGAMLKDISESVKPYLKGKESNTQKRGRVIIGTVEGDIHDIGKDIVVTMLEVNGYDVMDLGVDVPPSRFVDAAKAFKPQVIGLSGFLTLVYDPMKETIAALRAEKMDGMKFMIGGGQIDDQVMHYTGADGWGSDAIAAVNFCKAWIA